MIAILCSLLTVNAWAWVQQPVSPPMDIWELALSKQGEHRFSTLVTARQVQEHLATDKGILAAISWCKEKV
jgi:hypothetical protein